MSTPANKLLVQRLADALNTGDLSIIDEIVASDLVDHNAGAEFPAGREGFKQLFTMFRSAFPDAHIQTDDLIAEGDRVVWRTITHGTHTGSLMGIPATNKAATWAGIDIFRIVDGRIVERWYVVDNLSQLQQLGLLPTSE